MSKSRMCKFLSGIPAVIIILMGCGSDFSADIVFGAEKMYHQASQDMQTMTIKPELVNESQFGAVKDAFLAVTDYCYENAPSLPGNRYPKARHDLQSIAFLATNQISRFYFSENNFDSAIYVISQFLAVFQPEGIPLLNSKLNLARAYRSKGDLEQTMAVYVSLLDTFYPPVDNNNEIITRVLNLPLNAVQTYTAFGDKEAARQAIVDAEDYFRKIIDEWSNSDLELAARSNLARLYYDIEEWQKAIDALSHMRDSAGQIDFNSEMMIARIYLDGMKDYDRAIDLYDRLLERTADTNIIPSILMYQGIAHFNKDDFDECRQLMSRINDDYNSYFRGNPTPQQYIALSFAKKGDWTLAENEYKWLIDNYPATMEAFDSYLIIADHHKREGNDVVADNWLGRADEFYAEMERRYKGDNIHASAISYRAEVARRENRWFDAAKLLESIYDLFPGSDMGRRSMITAASIYRDRLYNPGKADSIINRLKAELIPVDNSKNIGVMTDDN